MKILPLKFLSPLDKAKNLLNIMKEAENLRKSNIDKKVEIMGSEFTIKELREIYKLGLKTLSHDKFETTKHK